MKKRANKRVGDLILGIMTITVGVFAVIAGIFSLIERKQKIKEEKSDGEFIVN